MELSTTLLFLETIRTGTVMREWLFIAVIAWASIAALVSIFFSAVRVGLPLYRTGRPLASLTMTLLCGVTMIIPTMSFIAVKIMGGLCNEE